jgi:hypothetical protein
VVFLWGVVDGLLLFGDQKRENICTHTPTGISRRERESRPEAEEKKPWSWISGLRKWREGTIC